MCVQLLLVLDLMFTHPLLSFIFLLFFFFFLSRPHHVQGGVRVNAFVSGGFVPPNARGRKADGIVHIADWWVALRVVCAPVCLCLFVCSREREKETYTFLIFLESHPFWHTRARVHGAGMQHLLLWQALIRRTTRLRRLGSHPSIR